MKFDDDRAAIARIDELLSGRRCLSYNGRGFDLPVVAGMQSARFGLLSQKSAHLPYFLKTCFIVFMKHGAGEDAVDEHLQVQVPAVTKRDLGQRALDEREPIRMIVLRALKAYGVTVPADAIHDRRKQR